jgi:uncharacterized protein (DUF927 family)
MFTVCHIDTLIFFAELIRKTKNRCIYALYNVISNQSERRMRKGGGVEGERYYKTKVSPEW